MRLLTVTQKVDKNDENLGFFHRWLEEFAKKSSAVVVIAHSVGSHTLPAHMRLEALGTFRGIRKVQKLFRFWRLFYRGMRESDAVFFHMIPEFVIAASPLLLFSKKPTLLWYVHKSVTWKLRLAERLVDWVATASELSFRLPSKKVIYTGHAIDTEFFQPLAHPSHTGGIRLLSIGRIAPVKELEVLIRACAVLKNEFGGRPWSLSVVGGPLVARDHEYLKSLKHLVKERGLESYIHFYGARPYAEVPALYRDHDIFISLSRTGSIDKSVLEAMASGLTVICANEAFRGLLPEKYFLEIRSPELLAARVKMLTHDPRPNIILRDLVRMHHDLGSTIEKIMELFRRPL